MSFWLRICAVISAVAAALFILPTVPASAADNDWSNSYPTTGTVTIPRGQTVVLDVDVNLKRLVVEGTLVCGDTDVELRSETILIGGALRCGTNRDRHMHDFTITLTGNGSGNVGGFGDKYLVAKPGANIYLAGEERTAWVRLTQTAPAGANTLTLEPNDWRVGDRIAIAPTDFRAEQAETAVITAKTGNTVTLDRPLDYMHYCGTESYNGRSITQCAEVGLLSHNITIRGNSGSATTKIGGHTMFHAGSRIRIRDVEFARMGQIGRLGRYPVHFHLFGDASDSYFINNSVWGSYNRWVTLHGAQNLRFETNVGYDTLGHGFYMEDGDEIGNRIVKNLGILALGAPEGQRVTPSDGEAAVYWFANPDNYVVGNVAAGGDHSGFWYSLPERPLGSSPNQHLRPRETPLDRFHNNVAHSVGFAGLMVDRGERPDRTLETTWYNPREIPGDDSSPLVRPEFTSFTSYKSRHYGIWLRTFSGVKFNRAMLADNWRSLYIANIQAHGSTKTALVTNSLLIGETDNIGQAESWETTGSGGRTLPKFWEPEAALGGIPFYDGPLHVKNTTFANFQPNGQRDAGALTNLFPNAFWVSPENTAANVEFVNSNRVLLPDVVEFVDGDATTLFTDRTGSVTGTPDAVVSVGGSILDVSENCTDKPEWNAVQCDPSIGHSSFSIQRLDGGWARVNLERSDGASIGFDGSSDRSNRVFVMLVTDMPHELTWLDSTPNQWNLYSNGISRNGKGQGARFSFEAPSGNWEFQVNGRYSSTSSLAALESGGSKWYYDAATNMIHVRLAGGSNWVTLREG